MRILLVEDDKMIAHTLSGSLKDVGYAVDWVNTGKLALSATAAQAYDLILLDLGLPEKDGLHVLAQWRSENNTTPIIILTARDDIHSRLAGLDGGADDYLVKPFDLSELHARMRAVLRRKSGNATPKPSNGILTLDPTTYQVQIAGQPESILLSNKEFAILNALILRAGIIHSRAELEDKLYGWGDEVESNAVDYLIHALRKKIGKEHIKNVRGVGWLVSKE
ncbi:response regulator [Alysiella filiformis]|uniref:Two-component system, OmpR family, response regulator n=1 Tax=Alysiella filiformis DSM 16848 TaxID=1120981 RepID=A0A286EDD7_9NEIS|nr:response regulator [Alysiella filiformis]QMT31200.1 response regulator [Alysiella filiformis]UBQ55805.1 response regulator [Alysiella filiformis DSM 16848]SOD68921.1 two-component system, OmpR family, response regulator [Alysiella filiformis DSM 16848]